MEINRERFEAYLFGKDKNEVWEYLDCHNCLIGRFIKETTNHKPTVAPSAFRVDGKYYEPIPPWLLALLAKRFAAGRYVYTYGHMQDAYIQLYGDPRIPSPMQAIAIEAGLPPVQVTDRDRLAGARIEAVTNERSQ